MKIETERKRDMSHKGWLTHVGFFCEMLAERMIKGDDQFNLFDCIPFDNFWE